MSYDNELKHLEVRLEVQQRTVELNPTDLEAETELERIYRAIQELEERS